MNTRRVRIRFDRSVLLLAAALGVAMLGVAAPLGAQDQRATLAVRAEIGPAATGIPSVLPETVLASITANGEETRTLATGEHRVRSSSGLEVWVRREDGGWAAGPPGASARVWVRDDRGELRPLVAGGAVPLGGRRAGEDAAPILDYRADGAPGGRAVLVYELRVVGRAQ